MLKNSFGWLWIYIPNGQEHIFNIAHRQYDNKQKFITSVAKLKLLWHKTDFKCPKRWDKKDLCLFFRLFYY